MKKRLMRPLLLVAGLSVALLSSAAGIDDIIIESTKQGKNFEWYKELSGPWAESIAKSRAEGLSARSVGSRFVASEPPPQAQAIFQPVIPQQGQWQVSVTWGMSANALNVKYVVFDGKNEYVRYLDQSGWGGDLPANYDSWHTLGVFNFPKGSQAYVKVDTSEVKGKPSKPDNGRVYADTVRFHFAAQDVVTTAPPVRAGVAAPFIASPIATQSPQRSEAFVTPTSGAPALPVQAGNPGAGGIDWLTDYSRALAEAKSRRKYIVLFFHYSSASESQRMNDEVMGNPKVIQELNRFICCKLNPVEVPQIATYYSVIKAPAVLILDSGGFLRGRQDGYVMSAIFISLLSEYQW